MSRATEILEAFRDYELTKFKFKKHDPYDDEEEEYFEKPHIIVQGGSTPDRNGNVKRTYTANLMIKDEKFRIVGISIWNEEVDIGHSIILEFTRDYRGQMVTKQIPTDDPDIMFGIFKNTIGFLLSVLKKDPEIDQITYSANPEETSRVRAYTNMTRRLAKRFRWKYDIVTEATPVMFSLYRN